ncbi:MAG: hypothetical protein HYZ15_04020 [Sphingobacteriales bacterium]|nr:hypothetical protein [Sphingobacteriales bacterium]
MEFEIIRDRIQQFRRSDLVLHLLQGLHNIQQEKQSRYPFWKMLVLLKWSYLHTDDNPKRKIVTSDNVLSLLVMVDQFEVEYTGLNFRTPHSVSQSFRIIAYQQFDYQDNFYNSIVDRQVILYLRLSSRFDIAAEFKRRTGIDILSFLNFCYFTYIYLHLDQLGNGHSYDGILHDDYCDYFKKQFSDRELDLFLRLLIVTQSSDFENLHRLKDERLQLYETNFFITKPFLLFNGHLCLPHQAIFTQTIKHFIYTYLKAVLPDTFPEEFGKRLEKYVALGLTENRIEHKSEYELKKQYRLTKICDYLVGDDILVECKATELHPRSGVLRLPNILTKELNSSIVKAYCQLLSTAGCINPGKEWWGIIITYREMYLGFGQDAWDEFLRSPMEDFTAKNKIDISLLPPKNLFFISIEDWDYIMQVIKDRNATLHQMLLKGKELANTTDPAERKFLMEQVLHQHFRVTQLNLSYLKQAHELINIVPETTE